MEFDDEIQISARTVGLDESLRSLPEEINCDALNAMLNIEVATISSNMEGEFENEIQLYRDLPGLRAAMVNLRGVAAKERMQYSDATSQLFNSLVEWVAPGAMLDVTCDRSPDYAILQTTH